MAYALALACVVGGCARPGPMVIANNYDVPLVVRVATATAAIDFTVPANARRDLESQANVESVVVFDRKCDTMSVIVFEPGAPTFEAGGVIPMDPVGLGDFVAGTSPSSGMAAEQSDQCVGVPTPAPAPD